MMETEMVNRLVVSVRQRLVFGGDVNINGKSGRIPL